MTRLNTVRGPPGLGGEHDFPVTQLCTIPRLSARHGVTESTIIAANIPWQDAMDPYCSHHRSKKDYELALSVSMRLDKNQSPLQISLEVVEWPYTS